MNAQQQHWDERYRQGEHPHDPPLDFIERLLPPGDGRQALDLACGAGRHAALMAQRGWQVTAVDWSSAALEIVRARDPRILTVQADLEANTTFLMETNRWDLICVTFYLQRELLPAAVDGLRQDGQLAVAFPLVDDREGVSPMRRQYSLAPGELRVLFDELEIVHYEETNPPPPKRRTAELWARKK